VLAFAIGLRDRQANGSLRDDAPMELSLSDLGRHLGLPKSSASGALAELVTKKRLNRISQGVGRRAARYELVSAYRKFVPVARA